MKKKYFTLFSLLMLMLLLTGCMSGDGTHATDDPAGFFWGVWHGWIAPFSLIFGWFDQNIRVYEGINTGWWYDLGFYMAIISGFGGLSLFRKRSSKD